ncbi:hypothetical protein D3C83_26300 [compost metagenome]
MLDFGVAPFVAVARQVLVERLERDLLALRLGNPVLEDADLDLCLGGRLTRLLRDQATFLGLSLERRKPARKILPERLELPARVVPLPDRQRDGDQCDEQHYCGKTAPEGGGLLRGRLGRRQLAWLGCGPGLGR